MERSMGRENLRRMIKQFEEDEMNRRYMEESTTGCPHCGVRCEKSHGEIIYVIAIFTPSNGNMLSLGCNHVSWQGGDKWKCTDLSFPDDMLSMSNPLLL
jgi:hypothetical protein